ncbi:MAG: HEPN domain-containing protein [Candidatus Hydrogenedentes bacterium]|nr:HEPN domain-containing protein [Candidatus Hydrogenedentota bacterium]
MKCARENLQTTTPSAFTPQQCAEKYLKGTLQENEIPFAKIHDLVVLLDAVVHVAPLLEPFRSSLAMITDYAVTFRYPGETSTKEMAHDAIKACTAFRASARVYLGLLPDD